MDNYKSKFEISSNSKKFYNCNKITKFGLNSTIA